ncbi:phage tail protein I [Citrobacter braakii]|uniref:phage tail protein I n=1 Tax=Citrobacter braakii TaxID=57706 RepID=UPI00378AED6A
MTAKFRSLLPPGAFHEERAQEQASAEQIATLDTNMVRKSKNPDTCPAHLLPWLAWEHAVDFWDDGWTEAQKRQVIKDAAYVHQHRGTAGAVRRSLGSVNLPTTVVEWWEDTPRAEPYTFRIEVQSSGRRYTKNFLRGVEKTPPPRRMQERATANWRTFDSASIE